MIKTIKNILLVDETQPLEKIKRQYKSKVYWFLGLSWLLSFLLIWIIPQNIMQYTWAKNFVDFMGVVVPMVDGLEHIRLYGPSHPYKAHLIVLPHISFHYAFFWAYAWLSVPYMFFFVNGNFRYNKNSNIVSTKGLVERYHNNKFVYYFGLFFALTVSLFMYIHSESATGSFKLRYVYEMSAGVNTFIGTVGMLFIIVVYFYTHFLIKQQERNHAK